MKITLYRSLPEPIRSLVRLTYSSLPFGIRMGRTYRETVKFLRSKEGYGLEEIEKWQLERLRKVISHAYDNVPGYRQLYDEAHVSPADLKSADDLKHFPFVTKEIIRDNLADFTARNIPAWKHLYRTTGGSTGIPFGFYLLQENIEREFAFLHSAWKRAGWKPGDSSAVLRGAFVGSEEKFWDYDPFLKDLRLSTYYLNEKTYSSYRAKLLTSRPTHLQAYPSAANLLAELIVKNGDSRQIHFSVLLLGSENLYSWQTAKISEAFPSSRIFSWYGHAEQVLFAPMCEKNRALHMDPFYGYGEILSDDGRECAIGESGELVGTSFWNTVTPFIRYRTMDIGRRGEMKCPDCGRPYQLLDSIEGRLQELIVTKSGRYISMTAINMHSDVFDNVRQFQFRQKESGKVTFCIVRKDQYGEEDTRKIRTELMKKLGDDMELEITFVESIQIPKSGKFRFLIQELPISYGDHDRPR